MRLALLLSLAVAVLAQSALTPEEKAKLEKDIAPNVTEFDKGKEYIVNLACEGCPNAYGEQKAALGDYDNGTSLVSQVLVSPCLVCGKEKERDEVGVKGVGYRSHL